MLSSRTIFGWDKNCHDKTTYVMCNNHKLLGKKKRIMKQNDNDITK